MVIYGPPPLFRSYSMVATVMTMIDRAISFPHPRWRVPRYDSCRQCHKVRMHCVLVPTRIRSCLVVVVMAARRRRRRRRRRRVAVVVVVVVVVPY